MINKLSMPESMVSNTSRVWVNKRKADTAATRCVLDGVADEDQTAEASIGTPNLATRAEGQGRL